MRALDTRPLPEPVTAIVFWQPMPSIHQASFIAAVADLFGGQVHCVYSAAVSQDRQSLGWPGSINLGAVISHSFTEAREVREIFPEKKGTLHVFSGIHCCPRISQVMIQVLRAKRDFAVISEAFDLRGWKGAARRARSFLADRAVRSAAPLMFVMGKLGVECFRRLGYRPDRLAPFAYSVAPAAELVVQKPRPHFTIVFVGQLIHRKAVDVLLRALGQIKTLPWTLLVIGDGLERGALEALSLSMGIADRCHFLGNQSNAEVRRVLPSVDLVVLPSRFDGWGAVVNEALAAGTPVICSSRCGAADLLSSPEAGCVVPAEECELLARAIRTRVESGRQSQGQRDSVRALEKKVQPESVARYFLDVILADHAGQPFPQPPWRVTG